MSLYSVLTGGELPLGGESDPSTIDAKVRDDTFHDGIRCQLRGRASKIPPVRIVKVAEETIEFVLQLLTVDDAVRPSAAALLASDYFGREDDDAAMRHEARILFGDERRAAGGGAGVGAVAVGGAASAP